MCGSRRRRDADALRRLFLARLQRLLTLRARAAPDPQRLLLIERAVGSTLVDCLRLGALGEALALLRAVWDRAAAPDPREHGHGWPAAGGRVE
jgi:hypothetical protein